jgi:hypothetical protein
MIRDSGADKYSQAKRHKKTKIRERYGDKKAVTKKKKKKKKKKEK